MDCCGVTHGCQALVLRGKRRELGLELQGTGQHHQDQSFTFQTAEKLSHTVQ